jgi:hypothetical protein
VKHCCSKGETFIWKYKIRCHWLSLFAASDMQQNELTLTREELYNAIWRTPMSHLCKTWGITIHHLSKICEQFDIPRPSPDYWPLLRLNRSVERAPLPLAASDQPSVICLKPQPANKPASLSKQQNQLAVIADKNEPPSQPENPPRPVVPVAQDFRKAHPLIRTSRELLEKANPDSFGRVGLSRYNNCVNINVTKQNLKRALLLLDAVFNALESKGHKAEIIEPRYGRSETSIKIGDEKVRIKLMERTTRRERELTEKEKTEKYIWNRHFYEPTGIFSFSIEEYRGPVQKTWTDRKGQSIENTLNEVIEAILSTGEALRLYRIEEAERREREAEQEKREYELQQLREQELNRRRSLEQQADRWEKAALLREFIVACEVRLTNQGMLSQDSSAKRWLDWARQCAEELDPLNGSYLQHAIHSLPDKIFQLAVMDSPVR